MVQVIDKQLDRDRYPASQTVNTFSVHGVSGCESGGEFADRGEYHASFIGDLFRGVCQLRGKCHECDSRFVIKRKFSCLSLVVGLPKDGLLFEEMFRSQVDAQTLVHAKDCVDYRIEWVSELIQSPRILVVSNNEDCGDLRLRVNIARKSFSNLPVESARVSATGSTLDFLEKRLSQHGDSLKSSDYQIMTVLRSTLEVVALPLDRLVEPEDLPPNISNCQQSLVFYQLLDQAVSAESICSLDMLANFDNRLRMVPDQLVARMTLIKSTPVLHTMSYSCPHGQLSPTFMETKDQQRIGKCPGSTVLRFFAHSSKIEQRDLKNRVTGGDPADVNVDVTCVRCLTVSKTRFLTRVLEKSLFLAITALFDQSNDPVVKVAKDSYQQYIKYLFGDCETVDGRREHWLGLSRSALCPEISDTDTAIVPESAVIVSQLLNSESTVSLNRLKRASNDLPKETTRVIEFIKAIDRVDIRGRDAGWTAKARRLNRRLNAFLTLNLHTILVDLLPLSSAKRAALTGLEHHAKRRLESDNFWFNPSKEANELIDFLQSSQAAQEVDKSLAEKSEKDEMTRQSQVAFDSLDLLKKLSTKVLQEVRVKKSAQSLQVTSTRDRTLDREVKRSKRIKSLVRESLQSILDSSLFHLVSLLSQCNESREGVDSEVSDNDPDYSGDVVEPSNVMCFSAIRTNTIKKSLFSTGNSARIKTDFSEDEDNDWTNEENVVMGHSSETVEKNQNVSVSMNEIVNGSPTSTVCINKVTSESTKKSSDSGEFLLTIVKKPVVVGPKDNIIKLKVDKPSLFATTTTHRSPLEELSNNLPVKDDDAATPKSTTNARSDVREWSV